MAVFGDINKTALPYRVVLGTTTDCLLCRGNRFTENIAKTTTMPHIGTETPGGERIAVACIKAYVVRGQDAALANC